MDINFTVNQEQSLMNDTETSCYEILQLRKALKYIVDDIYSGTYSQKDLCKTLPLLSELTCTIRALQNNNYEIDLDDYVEALNC